MRRETLYLNAESFTSMSALVREVSAILEATRWDLDQLPSCKIVIRANKKQAEELSAELEPIKQQWRVRVEEIPS